MEFGGSCVAKMGDVVVSVGGDSVTSVEALCDGYCGGGGGRVEWVGGVLRLMSIQSDLVINDQHSETVIARTSDITFG